MSAEVRTQLQGFWDTLSISQANYISRLHKHKNTAPTQPKRRDNDAHHFDRPNIERPNL